MHWPLPASVLRPLIPPALEIDVHDGQAWIGVVPFRMTGVRPRCVPAVPGFSAFAEINVRTYVTQGGKPGVWFFSLDAASRPAVWAARRTFFLPYYYARIDVQERNGRIAYQSIRNHPGSVGADFFASYYPIGAAFPSSPSSIDYWFTERYCLYAADRQGRIFRGEIHHAPWPLQAAAAEVRSNTMTLPLNVRLPDTTPLLHFARRLDVVAWTLEALS
jgi:uncharacterized protein YqjF (DUF2071 family)